jgi:hypothetical protein
MVLSFFSGISSSAHFGVEGFNKTIVHHYA